MAPQTFNISMCCRPQITFEVSKRCNIQGSFYGCHVYGTKLQMLEPSVHLFWSNSFNNIMMILHVKSLPFWLTLQLREISTTSLSQNLRVCCFSVWLVSSNLKLQLFLIFFPFLSGPDLMCHYVNCQLFLIN